MIGNIIQLTPINGIQLKIDAKLAIGIDPRME